MPQFPGSKWDDAHYDLQTRWFLRWFTMVNTYGPTNSYFYGFLMNNDI